LTIKFKISRRKFTVCSKQCHKVRIRMRILCTTAWWATTASSWQPTSSKSKKPRTWSSIFTCAKGQNLSKLSLPSSQLAEINQWKL
jgi:hypothetical protein